MKTFQCNKVNAVIAGATLALIALVLLQAHWLLHSKNLIEEQFNQKVSMAVSMAITDLGEGPKTCIANTETNLMTMLTSHQLTSLPPKSEEEVVKAALDKAMAFYDIEVPYEIEIADKQNTCISENEPGCCSLGTVSGYNDQLLNVTFPNRTQFILNRTQFILGEMGFMIGSSILILLFVSTVFGLATYYLIQQKKIGERNKDFFNNMAHEFKTPLTNIILANNLLAKKAPTPKQNTLINITKKEANKLIHQVERVLYLAKMERDDYALNKEDIQLHKIISEVVEDMAIQIEEKQAIIHINMDPNLRVEGDKFHLSNAFRNIIDNALKYANQTPEISISAKEKDTGILLLFKDNGIGITKSEQAIIFDKFQRISTGDIHNQKGFGLGLAYVKKVVELHQGFIQIFSELNKGSRFDLFLPTTP